MTATNLIHPGDIVVYTGSITALNGPVAYWDICRCYLCDSDERCDCCHSRRYTLVTADRQQMDHVRRASFTRHAGDSQVPDALFVISEEIRSDQPK